MVRIWMEQTPAEVEGGTWRGHIASLPDQDRQYVESLPETAAFIEERLHEIGFGPGAADKTQ